MSLWLVLLKRPPKRLKAATASLLTVALLQLGAAVPDSKLSANTGVAPWRTTTLSRPQLSLLMSSSPPSLKAMVEVVPVAVKFTVTLRYTASS